MRGRSQSCLASKRWIRDGSGAEGRKGGKEERRAYASFESDPLAFIQAEDDDAVIVRKFALGRIALQKLKKRPEQSFALS